MRESHLAIKLMIATRKAKTDEGSSILLTPAPVLLVVVRLLAREPSRNPSSLTTCSILRDTSHRHDLGTHAITKENKGQPSSSSNEKKSGKTRQAHLNQRLIPLLLRLFRITTQGSLRQLQNLRTGSTNRSSSARLTPSPPKTSLTLPANALRTPSSSPPGPPSAPGRVHSMSELMNP